MVEFIAKFISEGKKKIKALLTARECVDLRADFENPLELTL